MKARGLWLLLPLLLLTGCLLSINHPLVGPDGTVAFFLSEDGRFALFPKAGTLHLLRNGELVAVPGATISETSCVLDWCPDGAEILFVQVAVDEESEETVWTLHRVGASPDAVPVAVLESEEPIRDAAFTLDGRIAILRYGAEDAGDLELLDPDTGVPEPVFDDVLGFRLDRTRASLIVFHLVDEGPVPMGRIVRWRFGVDDRRLGVDDPQTLAVFTVGEQTLSDYNRITDVLLWDADPYGRWIALALYDQGLIDPPVENEFLTLFLIDTVEENAKRISPIARAPSFSTDGSRLAYIATDDGENGYAVVYDLELSQSELVPGGAGATTCFWMGPDELGLAFESDDDTHRLVTVRLDTGEVRTLFE
jgi:hypothetical protein